MRVYNQTKKTACNTFERMPSVGVACVCMTYQIIGETGLHTKIVYSINSHFVAVNEKAIEIASISPSRPSLKLAPLIGIPEEKES